MSRIHDALKKAEEEKRFRAVPEALEAAAPAASSAIPMAAVSAWAAPAGGNASSLPGNELLERCARRTWNPDQRTMLFFGQQEQSMFSEGFRTLRSRLLQVREKQPLKRLLISSALPGEGKTFVSANLAQALVRQKGHRVLLIDTDLRLPQVHTALGAPVTPGLSDYLRGKADEFSILQHGPLENLFFMPGGSAVSDPAELVASPKLKLLLDRMSPAFDWVILDSPPAVPVADASILAGLCDGVILVVEAASTPVELAQKARSEFRDRQILGVVLNRVQPRDSYGSYAYYSLYGRDGKKRTK
jgi:capsular exopolysaccharide synthesis family protein